MALYRVQNSAMPTTAPASAQTSNASNYTSLQIVADTNVGIKVVEWGVSFNGAALAAGFPCELVQTGTVAATMSNAFAVADVMPYDAAGISQAQSGTTSGVPLKLSTSTSGWGASGTEGSTTTCYTHDYALVEPIGGYFKQFPLGREPWVPSGNVLRVRVKGDGSTTFTCYIVFEVSPVATAWAWQSTSVENTGSAATIAVTLGTVLAGDLLVSSWGDTRATTSDNACTMTDTGSGGWTLHPSGLLQQSGGGVHNAAGLWYKVATGADSGATVTATPSGGSGTRSTNNIEVDVYRLTGGYKFLALDIYGSTTNSGSVTTSSINAAANSSYPAVTDQLAVTAVYNGNVSMGAPTGSNTFKATGISAVNLAVDKQGNQGTLCCQSAGGVQTVATASGNTWKNTWTTTGAGSCQYGATFVYSLVQPNQYPSYVPQIRASYW